jgi:hypothetical protein
MPRRDRSDDNVYLMEDPDDEELTGDGTEDVRPAAPAGPLALRISRPETSLPTPPRGDFSRITVSLLGDPGTVPPIEAVERTNREADSESRTPLMTVIQALIVKNGGMMRLEDITAQVRKYWNRDFPGSPYTPTEFVYVVVSNSDSLSVRVA